LEAEDLFPKAYEPAFGGLLDVLVERLGPEESEALLRSVGRRPVEGKTVLSPACSMSWVLSRSLKRKMTLSSSRATAVY
jgi:hypothetical protein